MNDIVVIDEAGIVQVISRGAERQSAPERHVHRRADVGADLAAFAVAVSVAANFERERVEVGTVRDVAHGAAERTRAVECALRTKQDFHALDIVQAQIHEERDFAEIGGDRAAAVIGAVIRASRVSVEAAHDDRVRRTSALIDDEEARHPLGQLGKIAHA